MHSLKRYTQNAVYQSYMQILFAIKNLIIWNAAQDVQRAA